MWLLKKVVNSGAREGVEETESYNEIIVAFSWVREVHVAGQGKGRKKVVVRKRAVGAMPLPG